MRLLVGSWNHNFITKSLDGVVRGLLCFPLIKSEVFKDSTDMNTHFYPLRDNGRMRRLLWMSHLLGLLTYTSALAGPDHVKHLSGLVLVRHGVWDKSVYSCFISVFFRMGFQGNSVISDEFFPVSVFGLSWC